MEINKAQGSGLKAQGKAEVEEFSELDSIKVIQEMIKVSRGRLENNGILFIMWGWLSFLAHITDVLENHIVLTYTLHETGRIIGLVLAFGFILFTIYYVFFRKKEFATHIDKLLLYVWVSWLITRILINLIMFRQLGTANFELQHPIFMVLTAFAVVITAGILKYKILFVSGFVFGLAAFVCSYFPLEIQQWIAAFVWLFAFALPGHILYSKRKR